MLLLFSFIAALGAYSSWGDLLILITGLRTSVAVIYNDVDASVPAYAGPV